jgi:uracil-DNA glycosylase
MYADLGVAPDALLPTSGDLTYLARQGVLLLNSVLTVPRSEAAGHRGRGWEGFTDAVLAALDASEQPIAFILWGKDARAKVKHLTNPDHLVIESDHPSPLSAWRGFFGSRPFSRVNEYLQACGCEGIHWI